MTDNVNNNYTHDKLDGEDEDEDESLASMLDDDLRPENPIDNPESLAIYHEHNRLIKEYFKGLTKMVYAQDFKKNLLMDMKPNDRLDKEELLNKMKDKVILATNYIF